MFSQNECLLQNTLEILYIKILEGHGPTAPSADAHECVTHLILNTSK